MKIRCQCGYLIVDTSDFIAYKGYIVPDQDIEDFEEGSNTQIYEKSRIIYQCESCGRLAVDIDNEIYFFTPEISMKKVLSSVEGEKWKRNLRGHWKENYGEIWFDGIHGEYIENIKNYEEAWQKYVEIFKRLKSQNILRNAFFSKNGKVIHKWTI